MKFFFTKNPNLKSKFCFWLRGGDGGGGRPGAG